MSVLLHTFRAEDADIQVHDLGNHGVDTVYVDSIMSSYSWEENTQHPTIAIPGNPSILVRVPTGSCKIPADGLVFCDENGYRVPTSPTDSLFMSAYIASKIGETALPGENVFKKFDFITDRSNLKYFLNFLRTDGDKIKFHDKDFEMSMDLIGDVCVFTRCGITETNSNTFGHSFEKYCAGKSTTEIEDNGRESGFYTISAVTLGNSKILLRAEIDLITHSKITPRDLFKIHPASKFVPDIVKCSTKVKNANTVMTEVNKLKHRGQSEGVNAVYKDSIMKDEKYFLGCELKTRVMWNRAFCDWYGMYVQMLLGSCNTLILGLHEYGTFKDHEILSLQDVKKKSGISRLSGGFDNYHTTLFKKLEKLITLIKRKAKEDILKMKETESRHKNEVHITSDHKVYVYTIKCDCEDQTIKLFRRTPVISKVEKDWIEQILC